MTAKASATASSRRRRVPHQGLLPGGVFGIGVIVVGVVVMVGSVRRRKDNARRSGVRVASVGVRGRRVALVVACGGVVVLPVSGGYATHIFNYWKPYLRFY
jgi:hypothetical protein